MRRPEQEQQIALMDWARLARATSPDLDLLFHIPNGGGRSKAEAGIFKAMGVKAGIPDLFLSVPNQNWHGLYIEMKSTGGRVSPEQKDVFKRLGDKGYAVFICRDWIEAKDAIRSYLADEA